ncbi:MAG: PGF-CTERM sorting domain-containing protein [archaeon]|nr:PGF-CTERM sorting domain-containing protein [archaeon]
MNTRRKGKAITGIAMAAIVLASVFAVMISIAGAESRGDNFNHIVKQTEAQKVLLGQDLQFENFTPPLTVTRIEGGDIASIYHPDSNNRTYNVNWAISGVYYVNYRNADYEAQLSIDEPDMPLELRVGTTKVSSVTVGTEITIDTSGMNIFPEDVVDLIVRGPDGQIRFDTVNDQEFTDITVKELNNMYGADGIETTGWMLGDYTFQIGTNAQQACGLEAESEVKPLKIMKGGIAIEAEPRSSIELETVKLRVTGASGDKIEVDAPEEGVRFKGGIDDTPLDATNCFSDTIDADGMRNYALEFTETGNYKVGVTVTEGPREGDDDAIEITVVEKEVIFDLPDTVTIGDKITVKGTATSGTYVSVYVEDVLYSKLENIIIDEDGEFSKEVRTTDVGMEIPGRVELEAWIDCEKDAGQSRPSQSPDGEDRIWLERPVMSVEISATRVVPEDKFSITGTAEGETEVLIIAIPPTGGKSLLDGGKSISLRKASVSGDDDKFSKKLTIQEDAAGYYWIYVLSPGMDRVWGTTGQSGLDAALGERFHLSLAEMSARVQWRTCEIIEDLVTCIGSDDIMFTTELKVQTAYVDLEEIQTVLIGEPLVVSGHSNRNDGYPIVVTCEGPAKLLARTELLNGTFSVSFDTMDVASGNYTIMADDGDGHADEQIVKIEMPYITLDSIAEVDAGEALVITGKSNRQDGHVISVTCKGPEMTISKRVKVKNSMFKATFNTTGAVEGTYTVKAEDRYGFFSGAVATVNPAPTPTPTPKPTATPTPTPPGFEAVFAIAGLLAIAYLVRRTKN